MSVQFLYFETSSFLKVITWSESIPSTDYINNLRFAPALDSYHGKPVESASSGCMV